jgi:tetratricopeptide (TPR) repeat protein
MGFGKEDGPLRVAVEEQLRKILSSEEFRTAEKGMKFLRIVVEGTLNEKELAEKDIGPQLFDNFEPEDSSLRVNANGWRKKLLEYYKGAGARDLVIIEIPKGAYRAKFSYNRHSWPVYLMARANALARALNFDLKNGSLSVLYEAIKIDAHFGTAFADLVEHWVLLAIMRRVTGLFHRVVDDERTMKIVFEKSFEEFPESARIWLARGAWLAMGRRWAGAEFCFKKALEIDRVKTLGSVWFGFFLLLMGEKEAALKIAEVNAFEQTGRDDLMLAYGFFLYMSRDFTEARNVLSLMTGMGSDTMQDVRNVLLGLILLAEEHYILAASCFVISSRANREEAVELFGEEPNDAEWPHRYLGMIIYCFVMAGKDDLITQYVEVLGKQKHIPPLQRMFLHAAGGNGKHAITALRASCLQGDLISCALHLWPFLDAYRDHPRFVRLMERLELPPEGLILRWREIRKDAGKAG